MTDEEFHNLTCVWWADVPRYDDQAVWRNGPFLAQWWQRRTIDPGWAARWLDGACCSLSDGPRRPR